MIQRAPRLDHDRVARAVAELLAAVGEDVNRRELQRTPERVATAAAELLGGIGVDPVPMLREGRIPVSGAVTVSSDGPDAPGTAGQQPVLVRGASFRSMCEHHLLPFAGTIDVAYLPAAHIVGLGRIYDLIEIVTTRLTLQERIGDDVVDALMTALDARGAIARITATHGCVGLRGSRQERGEIVTVAARGALADAAGRSEIMALLAGPTGGSVNGLAAR